MSLSIRYSVMRSAPFIRGIFHPSRFAVAIYGEDFNDTVAERQYRLRFKPVLRIMKAAPFAYSRPATVDEACALLSADEHDAVGAADTARRYRTHRFFVLRARG